jgi:hypothetical protein
LKSTFLVIVSRYATCGGEVTTSALYSRFMRSMYTSRWSSPMPAMIVSFDSAST